MQSKWIISILLSAGLLAFSLFQSCSASKELTASKSGVQLWGENCIRCHNAPSPETFSDAEWDVAVLHMRVRANLTQDEAVKISEFLKTAN